SHVPPRRFREPFRLARLGASAARLSDDTRDVEPVRLPNSASIARPIAGRAFVRRCRTREEGCGCCEACAELPAAVRRSTSAPPRTVYDQGMLINSLAHIRNNEFLVGHLVHRSFRPYPLQLAPTPRHSPPAAIRRPPCD